jgi:hypothetical protein
MIWTCFQQTEVPPQVADPGWSRKATSSLRYGGAKGHQAVFSALGLSKVSDTTANLQGTTHWA